MSIKSFKDFRVEKVEPVNEGSFDKLFSWMSGITNMFKNPEGILKSAEAVSTEEGSSALTVLVPDKVKEKETYFITLNDETGKNEKFVISLTKMGDMPEKSGLFQITGTTNTKMLMALVNSPKQEDLTKFSIMAIINDKSIVKGQIMEMKILKNVMPQGKDYKSNNKVDGITHGVKVEQMFKNQ